MSATATMHPYVSNLSLAQQCGQLLVVGFDGAELPKELAAEIRAGLRGGVILFRRNVPDLETAWRLCGTIRSEFPANLPGLTAIDQEGGRVGRLPPPFCQLPPMRSLGRIDDAGLSRRVGAMLGRQLANVGVTLNFAPVLDVDSNPDNPVIGDRSFGQDVDTVSYHAMALIDGMQAAGVAACGKHFPGHGDTTLDSHAELPTVAHDIDRLERIELEPFLRCFRASLASIMTAHVAYPALDASRTPATLSRPILTDLLRHKLHFGGVVFSDDLEMGAISRHFTPEVAACRAVAAGCDALLVCHSAPIQSRVHAALLDAAERDRAFAAAVASACERVLTLRSRYQPAQLPDAAELMKSASQDEDVLEIASVFRCAPP